jgi:uncharacterized BrkB/YihY/UPF0761 family membrane protein
MASTHREGSDLLYFSILLLLFVGSLIAIVVAVLSSLLVHRVESLIAVRFRLTMSLVVVMVWCLFAEVERTLSFGMLDQVGCVGPT